MAWVEYTTIYFRSWGSVQGVWGKFLPRVGYRGLHTPRVLSKHLGQRSDDFGGDVTASEDPGGLGTIQDTMVLEYFNIIHLSMRTYLHTISELNPPR